MTDEFPAAVPEIPVANFIEAARYYQERLGFTKDWGGEGGGIGQVSRGACRLFLTENEFRAQYGNAGKPVVIWLNLNDKREVDELHAEWSRNGARILRKPE